MIRFNLYQDPLTHAFSMQQQEGGQWVKASDAATALENAARKMEAEAVVLRLAGCAPSCADGLERGANEARVAAL